MDGHLNLYSSTFNHHTHAQWLWWLSLESFHEPQIPSAASNTAVVEVVDSLTMRRNIQIWYYFLRGFPTYFEPLATYFEPLGRVPSPVPSEFRRLGGSPVPCGTGLSILPEFTYIATASGFKSIKLITRTASPGNF